MKFDSWHKFHTALLAVSLIFLHACGGGGGGDTGSDTSTSSTSSTSSAITTTTATTTTTTLASGSAPSLSGVAATGAPLLGATVRVVDATGTPVGLVDASGTPVASGTTSLADGAYRLMLAMPSPKTPLFIQLTGLDAGGNPVVMHSLVQTGTLPLIANITPATNAVVAQVLGGDPKTVFPSAASNASAIALLGNAAVVTSASDLVKTIIKANLTDGKITDTTKLDFFRDASFTANKTGMDATLEGLRIQIVKDASGKEQLQFSNKFIPLGTAEVTIDLATAKAELTKASGGSVAKAITSTTKTTTSPTTIFANLGTLDDLGISLNKLIAKGSPAADFNALVTPDNPTAKPPYTYMHSGRNLAGLTSKLAGYATNNYQLSKFQVTGCADYPVTAKTCAKVSISALVTDTTGKRIEVFSDAASFSKTAWLLVGNNSSSDFSVLPVAYSAYGLDGTPAAGSAANPGYGVQLAISLAAGDTASRMVQIPSGNSILMAYCNMNYLCVQTTSSATPAATGELRDMLPQQLAIGSIGNLDSPIGAKYLVSLTGANAYSPAYLPAEVPTDLSHAPFPMPDGVTSAKPLTTSDISSSTGLNLSWANWAAANPNLRIILARTVISNASTFAYSDATLPPVPGTSINVPPMAVPASPTSYQVWLGAQDNLGRRYYSKFASSP